jgi:hypothetical protein
MRPKPARRIRPALGPALGPARRPSRAALVTPIALAVLLAAAPGPALAGDGALDRFEKAHQPPPDRSSDTKSSSKSDSSSSSSTTDDTSSTSSSTSSSGDASDGRLFVLFVCLVPPITFACLMPSHRVAAEPYATPKLYIEPEGPRGEDGRRYRRGDLERARIVEVGITGFRSLNEDVFSHELGFTLWLGTLLINGRWEHMYERIETTGGFDSLDILRAHLGANILGPFVDRAELYMNAGALFLRGDGDFLPAFDAGLELRVYPTDPLALRAASMASIFPIGPILVDTRLEAGIAMGPVEVRAGGRYLYQNGAQGFWGPVATVAGRF